jgi:hypothetical protein
MTLLPAGPPPSGFHVQAKLFLAPTKEFLLATLGNLTIFKRWPVHPNEDAINCTSTNSKAGLALPFKASCDASLSCPVCRTFEMHHSVLFVVDCVDNPPDTLMHLSYRDSKDPGNVIGTTTSKLVKSSSQTNGGWDEAILGTVAILLFGG